MSYWNDWSEFVSALTTGKITYPADPIEQTNHKRIQLYAPGSQHGESHIITRYGYRLYNPVYLTKKGNYHE
jgi:hypothetical protein